MMLDICATAAVIMLVVLGSHSEWPDPREGWARIIGAAVIFAAIWF